MTKSRIEIFLAMILVTGCMPGPRADRVFLPPAESARRTDERLHELQSRFERGLLTQEEYLRKRDEILKEAEFGHELENKIAPR